MPVIPSSTGTSTAVSDLVEEIRASLHSFTGDTENTFTLYSTVGTTDSTFMYSDYGVSALDMDRGVVEIDDELVHVAVVDKVSNNATVPAWGRGIQGTTAVAHNAGAKITQAPRFPRQRILSTVNEVIGALDTYLYAVKSDESNYANPVVNTYALPADVSNIIMVTQERIGPTGEWRKVTNWRHDLKADTTIYPTGKVLTFGRGTILEPGRRIKVTYAGRLTQLGMSDAYTQSGLETTARDLLVLGSMARLLLTVDTSRLQTSSVEQAQRAQFVPVGSAGSVASRYQQMFMQRMQDEKQRLERLYPSQMRVSR